MPKIRTDWLEYEIDRRAMTKQDFARKAGFHPTTISKALERGSIDSVTLGRLKHALATIPPDPAIDRLLYPPPESPEKVVA